MPDEFSELVIEHGTYPENYGEMAEYDGVAVITGPCGDTMKFWIQLTKDVITAVQFTTDGCISSRAAGSMTTVLALKKSIMDIAQLTQQDVLDALNGLPEDSSHCALLSTNTLKAACDNFMDRAKHSPYMPEDLIDTCQDCSESLCPALVQREGESDADWTSRQNNLATLCRIKHKLFVLSGKGGVGKSTVAVNLAESLSLQGFKVGLLDADIHGPSVPIMLGSNELIAIPQEGKVPSVEVNGIKVMSMAYLLQSSDTAAIWRGPMKMAVISQFISGVDWGELDYLIVDSPPGTGDEALSLAQLIPDADGAVIVTTPQAVATLAVSKCISFCRKLTVPVIGLIENMSGYICPKCGEVSDLQGSGGGSRLAESMHVPFLGSLPFTPDMVLACDQGKPLVKSHPKSIIGTRLREITEQIVDQTKQEISL